METKPSGLRSASGDAIHDQRLLLKAELWRYALGVVLIFTYHVFRTPPSMVRLRHDRRTSTWLRQRGRARSADPRASALLPKVHLHWQTAPRGLAALWAV